jgi:hypothetical protein
MKIHDNIPLPKESKGGVPLMYPFDNMEVNQCFIMIGSIKKYNSVRVSADSYGKRHGMKFIVRKIRSKITVWRTK